MNCLNTSLAADLFREICFDSYYVDKSMMIEKLNKMISTKDKYVCITRPRRFGKSINAFMVAAYYGMGSESGVLFNHLKIHDNVDYDKHLNKHNAIFMNLSKLPNQCVGYETYIEYVKDCLCESILHLISGNVVKNAPMSDYFVATKKKFIFIFDEWDYIFNDNRFSQSDKSNFLIFLKDLLKDQPYVELAYMTGILPIAKYSSGSALNMFQEYNFMNDRKFDPYFGFTEDEVRFLCNENEELNYDEIEEWYNGYFTVRGNQIFNPRSVVTALSNGFCDSYWTSTGPFDEISYYIQHNVEAVREDIVQMASNISLEINLEGYGVECLEINTRDRILSAMVIYGFLSYHDGYLKIPNKELMIKYNEVLHDKSMGYVYELALKSDEMLKATLHGDTKKMSDILDYVHDSEATILKYNDENALACLITLIYLSARNKYRIVREEASGKGYADFIFHPNREGDTAIILELKKDKGAYKAIEQIKAKRYYSKLKNIRGKILAVGISYNNDKEHECIVEDITVMKK